LKVQLELFLNNPNDNKISNDLKPAVIFYALNDMKDETELEKYFKL